MESFSKSNTSCWRLVFKNGKIRIGIWVKTVHVCQQVPSQQWLENKLFTHYLVIEVIKIDGTNIEPRNETTFNELPLHLLIPTHYPSIRVSANQRKRHLRMHPSFSSILSSKRNSYPLMFWCTAVCKINCLSRLLSLSNRVSISGLSERIYLQ